MSKNIEHFDRMKMMENYFSKHSISHKLYIPEAKTSEEVNKILKYSENLNLESAKKVIMFLEQINNQEHVNGVHWYDYTIHVEHALRLKGFGSLIENKCFYK